MANPPALDQLCLPLLLTARTRVISDGWGRTDHTSRWDLVSAVADGSLAGWRALELLRWLTADRNLNKWNDHPGRTGSEVVALLDHAIRELGGTPPRTRYREPRKRGGRAGGWSITFDPTSSRDSSGVGREPRAASHGAASLGALVFAHPSPDMSNEAKPPVNPAEVLSQNEKKLFEARKSFTELLEHALKAGPEASGLRVALVDYIGDLDSLVQRVQFLRIRAGLGGEA